ncbi:MAG: ATP-binding cassette domain-containing protein [Firmicutes bacterium]|nr:ATP-binding cassette domain-containing protein [Bacillota bacterium]
MESLDILDFTKDSLIYTFSSGFKTELDKYFTGKVKNVSEQKRYERQKAKHDRLTAKGKEPDWKVAAALVTDLEGVKTNLVRQIDRLIEHYDEIFAQRENRDYDAESIAVIDYLKMCASGVVNKVTKTMAKNRALKLMEEVGISEPRKRYKQYPFEFSGGMRQRIVIAIALAANPDILICDEPTTALDVTIQSQILELINKLKRERNLSVIFITHDLGVVANMADRIAVMYAGKIVEYGTSADIFYSSAHPYTWALLSSMPDLDTNEKLDAIPGTPPNMIYPPEGDAFAPRNKYAMQIDFERQPPMFKISDTHYAATWLLHPDAPKVDPPKIITDRIARMRKKMEARDGE